MKLTILKVLVGAACCLAAFPSAAQNPAPAAPNRVPVEDQVLGAEAFADIPFFEGAQLSPDGTRIAGKLGIGTEQAIGIVTRVGGKPPIVIGTIDGTEVRWLRWVNDRHVLVGLQALLPTVALAERTYVSRLISIDTTNSKITSCSGICRGRMLPMCFGCRAMAPMKFWFRRNIHSI